MSRPTAASRIAPVAVLMVAVLLVGYAIVMQFVGGGRSGAENGSPGSTRDDGAAGLVGWSRTLSRFDYKVDEVRKSLDHDSLPDKGALVVAAPEEMSAGEIEALTHWVNAGAGRRLVIVDPTEPALGVIGGFDPGVERIDVHPGEPTRTAATPITAGIARLDVEPHSALTPGDATTLYGVGGEAYALSITIGSNEIVAVADLDAVSNAGIIAGDNAAFAVALVDTPSRHVYFDQFHHTARKILGPLGYLDRGVQLFMMQLIAAGVVAAIGLSIRFGDPLPEPESPRRRRIEYVDAVAAAFAQSDGRDLSAAILQSDLRELLRRRLRSGADASDDALIAGVARFGLSPATVGRALDPSGGGLSFAELAREIAYVRIAVEKPATTPTGVRDGNS